MPLAIQLARKKFDLCAVGETEISGILVPVSSTKCPLETHIKESVNLCTHIGWGEERHKAVTPTSTCTLVLLIWWSGQSVPGGRWLTVVSAMR